MQIRKNKTYHGETEDQESENWIMVRFLAYLRVSGVANPDAEAEQILRVLFAS
jgi:hypothetical protein